MTLLRGMSRLEVPAAAVAAGLPLTVLFVAGLGMAPPVLDEAAAQARRAKDAQQVKQIHAAWITYSGDRNGLFPLPGDVDRLPVNGMEVPGQGARDESANQHANMHGVAIAMNFVSPSLLVSPAEANPLVKACDKYDYRRYDPIKDTYWDDSATGVKCDLATGCSTSYAAMPIDASRRRLLEWRHSGNNRFAVLGGRGPRGGTESGKEFAESMSLRLFGSADSWAGNTCFNDNHVEFGRSMAPPGLKAVGSSEPPVRDNLFRNDTHGLPADARNSDCWLVIQRMASGTASAPATTIDSADGTQYVSWD